MAGCEGAEGVSAAGALGCSAVGALGCSAAGTLGCSLTGVDGVSPDAAGSGAALGCVLLSLAVISAASGSSNTGQVKRVGWQTEQPASARSGNAAKGFTVP